MSKVAKKFGAILGAVAMSLSNVNYAAFAEDTEPTSEPVVEVTEDEAVEETEVPEVIEAEEESPSETEETSEVTPEEVTVEETVVEPEAEEEEVEKNYNSLELDVTGVDGGTVYVEYRGETYTYEAGEKVDLETTTATLEGEAGEQVTIRAVANEGYHVNAFAIFGFEGTSWTPIEQDTQPTEVSEIVEIGQVAYVRVDFYRPERMFARRVLRAPANQSIYNLQVGARFSGTFRTHNTDVYANTFDVYDLTGMLAGCEEYINEGHAWCLDPGYLGPTHDISAYGIYNVAYGYDAEVREITNGVIWIYVETNRQYNGVYRPNLTGYNNGQVVGYQRMGAWFGIKIPRKTISVSLTKTSGVELITKNNKSYSVEGAVYGVYTDEACNNKIGEIRTNADGYGSLSESVDNEVSTVYVKELTTPKGYLLDETVYTGTLSNNAATFNVEDQPANDPLVIRINKISEDEVENPASLEGAEFTINYYDEQYTSVDELPEKPTRSWVLATKKIGNQYVAWLSDQFKVSGDDFYYFNEQPTLPLGTITVQEKVAPTGYTEKGATFVGTNNGEQVAADSNGIVLMNIVSSDEDTGAVLRGGNEYNVIEGVERGGLKFNKMDEVTGLSFQGDIENYIATFTITNKNSYDVVAKGTDGSVIATVKAGESFDVTTDVNGLFDGGVNFLPVGKYSIKEKVAPTGMTLNAKTVNFEIKENGDVVDLTKGELVDNPVTGGFTFNKSDLGYGNRAQGDTNLSAGFELVNASAHAVVVDGKTYGVGEVITTFRTNTKGTYTSAKNLPYGTYRINETEAPVGYTNEGVRTTTFSIRKQDEVVDATGKVTNRVDVAKFNLRKVTVYGNSAAVDPEEGVEFTAILKSKIEELGGFQKAYDTIKSNTNENGDVVVDGKIVLTKYEYSIVKTDAEGNAESNDLAYGTYTVRQTSHYADTKDFEDDLEFVVAADGQDPKQYTVTNQAIEYYLRIVKTDSKTGNRIVNSGASFKITDKNGKPVTMKVGSVTYDTFRTASNADLAGNAGKYAKGTYVVADTEDNLGEVITPLTVNAGTYYVTEVDTPDGFLKLGKPVELKVTETAISEVDADGTPIQTATFENTQITGILEVNKSIKNYTADKTFINREDLSYIEFKLTADEDIYDKVTGALLTAKGAVANDINGNPVGSFHVNKDGYAKVVDLPLGHYTLTEVEADGFTAVESRKVTFEKKNEEDETYTVSENFENDTTKVEVSKTDVTGKKELEGAKLSVTDSKGKEVDSWTSTSKKHTIEGLKRGETYTLTETIAPNGYVKSSSIDFKVNEDGSVTSVHMVDKIVEISKVDASGSKEVEGATLTVSDVATGKVVDEWTSGKEAHKVNNLEVGHKYVLSEKVVADGYVKASDITFEVTDDGINQKQTMVDKRVEVSKTTVTGDKELEGAKLTVSDSEGNTVDEWTSTNKTHFVKGLEVGKSYTLTEETAPNGYVRATSVNFTVLNDGVDQKYTMVDTQVTVSKTDVTGEKELEGATLSVKDKDGNTVDEWVSGKEAHNVNGLTAGEKYTLTETTTPNGYVTATTIEFTASTTENEKVTMVDKRVEVSKTDVGGKELPGAKMQVVDTEGNVVDEWTSTTETHFVSGLKIGGTYTLKEDTAPLGYVKDTEITFTVEENSVNDKYTMTDETFTVKKVDMCGVNIDGAELTVVDSEGAVVDTWTTKANEDHKVNGLTVGQTYTIKETKVPDGYVKMADKTFKVTDDNADEILSLIDKQVEISKETVGGKELEGAILTVYDENGEVVESWTSGRETHYVTGLEVNKKYKLVEDTAPLGYIKVTEVEFTVLDNGIDQKFTMIDTIERVGKVDENGDYLSGVQMEVRTSDLGTVIDAWETGAHIVDITDAEAKKLEKGDVITKETETGEVVKIYPLVKTEKTTTKDDESEKTAEQLKKDACEVKATRDEEKPEVTHVDVKKGEVTYQVVIKHGDGTYEYHDVDLKGNETTHMVSNLVAGEEYVIVEQQTVDGYYYAENVTFTADAESDHTVTMVDNSINYRLNKVDEEGEPVVGVQLKLEDITNVTYEEVIEEPTEEPTEEVAEGETEEVEPTETAEGEEVEPTEEPEKEPVYREVGAVEVELPNGGITTEEPFELSKVLLAGHTYRITEVATTEGYAMPSTATLTFVVPFHAGSADFTDIFFTNVHNKVVVTKVDNHGRIVSGAKMSVWTTKVDEETGETVADEMIHEFTTTEEVEDISQYVRGGDGTVYLLREDETPFGLDTIVDLLFDAPADGQAAIIMAIDQVSTFKVNVIKVDKDNNAVKLQGAEFTLYNSEDKELAKGTTDAAGEVTFAVEYEDGMYLKETKAPNGYKLNEQKFDLTVDETFDFTTDYELTVMDEQDVKTGVEIGFEVAGCLGLSVAALALVLFMKKKEEAENA